VRQIVLDTETTGLEVSQGHRIIEIGCVEIVARRRTSRTYHRYLHPERDIDSAAEQVHGISREMLASQPRFREIAPEFLGFLAGAELIIHNAEFDLGFLNNELRLAGVAMEPIEAGWSVVDTLALARRLHPGQRNSLDALCRRYGVDNSQREHHGALLDAHLLADVYLAMTGGQAALSLDAQVTASPQASPAAPFRRVGLDLVLVSCSAEEEDAHKQQIALLERNCPQGALWRTLQS
jgi:DNA polymerase-3 subunit epsilon